MYNIQRVQFQPITSVHSRLRGKTESHDYSTSPMEYQKKKYAGKKNHPLILSNIVRSKTRDPVRGNFQYAEPIMSLIRLTKFSACHEIT